MTGDVRLLAGDIGTVVHVHGGGAGDESSS